METVTVCMETVKKMVLTPMSSSKRDALAALLSTDLVNVEVLPEI